MWKDFFYYSKSERRSVIVLISIGILLLVSGVWTHTGYQQSSLLVDSICLDSFCVRTYQKQLARDSFRWHKRMSAPVLADFDPNTIDSAGLCRLGLAPYLAKRIVRYRAKGGVFRHPSDFSRMYGLSEEQYHLLQPYIVIDTVQLEKLLAERSQPFHSSRTKASADDSFPLSLQNAEHSDSTHFNKHAVPRVQKYALGTKVDLNAADTNQLKRVPGIGSGLAKMIVSYRNRLGGYSQVGQLQEVADIDTAINQWFKIDSCIFRPLRVNRANLDQLRNHPYMNFYKAKAILEYRRKRGKIEGLPQLSMFQEFTEKDLQRLTPYLDFK